MAQWLTNQTRTHGLAQWVKDPALLSLWYRPAAAAPIQPAAWELPKATGVTQKKKRKKKKRKKLQNVLL